MKKNANKAPHTPILVNEMLSHFRGVSLKVFFEGTVGAGGHASKILEEHPEIECYIGCDQDPLALSLAKEKLKAWEDKVVLVHANFRNLDRILKEQEIETVDGFFLTLECRLCS